MYGIPLTIYLFSGWLGSQFPRLDLLSHDSGRLWNTLLGWKGDPHLSPLHVLSTVMIMGVHRVATTGVYAVLRHPQYAGFIAIMLGFLLQWPTLLTLLMFPILVAMYVRLARREEREAIAEFGDEYIRYLAVTPAFIPRLRRTLPRAVSAESRARGEVGR